MNRLTNIGVDMMLHKSPHRIGVSTQRRGLGIGIIPFKLMDRLLSDTETISYILLTQPHLSAHTNKRDLQLSILSSKDLRPRFDKRRIQGSHMAVISHITHNSETTSRL